MQIVLPPEKLYSLFHEGERLSLTESRLAISGRCTAPVTIECVSGHDRHLAGVSQGVAIRQRQAMLAQSHYYGLDDSATAYSVNQIKIPYYTHNPIGTVLLDVPCRRCAACLKSRSWMWQCRAITETALSARTWFCTFTCNTRARDLLAINNRAHTFDSKAMARVMLAEYTKFMKRLRKKLPKGSVKHFVVVEFHKDGFPHLHALIHEKDLAHPVRKREIQAQWQHGFTTVKLADTRACNYICKYLVKELYGARVRASLHYGYGL